jgi:hypothetical protein
LKAQNQEAVLKRIDAHLDREIQLGMMQAGKMLEEMLVMLLDRAHRRLVKGRISLPQYYKDAQMLMCCAQRLKDGDEYGD